MRGGEPDKNRYIGAVSVGFGSDGKRVRRKVSGTTKQEVRDKLKALHAELDVGVQSPAGYTESPSGSRSSVGCVAKARVAPYLRSVTDDVLTMEELRRRRAEILDLELTW